MHHRRMHLGGRGKGFGRQGQHDLRVTAPLRQQRQPPVGFRPRLRHDALGHFLLEHQRQAFPERRPGGRRQPADQQFGADIVGQVGHHLDRRHQQAGRIQRQRIGRDHLQPSGIRRRHFGQGCDTARVLLDRQHPPRPFGQQAPRQPARPRPDLKHIAPRQIARRPRNSGGQVQIQQKVLPQPLLRHQIMRRDHRAQRRQAINRAHSRPFLIGKNTPRGSGGQSPPAWPTRCAAAPSLAPAAAPPPGCPDRPARARQYQKRCHGRARCG